MNATAPKLTIDEAELLHLSGYDSREWLVRWLIDNRIKFFQGKDGVIFTTVGLLEAAKLPQHQQAPQGESIEF